MNAYLVQVLTVSLLCGLVELLTPAGEREGLRRTVRLLLGLFLLSVMIVPLMHLREQIASWDLGTWAREMEQSAQEDYEKLMEDKWTQVTEEQLTANIYALLASQFGVERSDCTVTVDWEESAEGARQVKAVWVAVRGKAILCDPRAIESAIEGSVGGKCTVSVG